MQPERSAARCDIGDHRTEFGEPLDHGLELVDDDDEPRELDVVVERTDVAGPSLGQYSLAMAQFGTQALHGALGLALIEIGDDARHMRQVADRLERRTALEVDEEECDPVGGIRARERRQPREQEFALAAARRTGDECVRTVLHQIDDE